MEASLFISRLLAPGRGSLKVVLDCIHLHFSHISLFRLESRSGGPFSFSWRWQRSKEVRTIFLAPLLIPFRRLEWKRTRSEPGGLGTFTRLLSLCRHSRSRTCSPLFPGAQLALMHAPDEPVDQPYASPLSLPLPGAAAAAERTGRASESGPAAAHIAGAMTPRTPYETATATVTSGSGAFGFSFTQGILLGQASM